MKNIETNTSAMIPSIKNIQLRVLLLNEPLKAIPATPETSPTKNKENNFKSSISVFSSSLTNSLKS